MSFLDGTMAERQSSAGAVPTVINSGGTASLSTLGLNMGVVRRARAKFLVGAVAGTLTLKLQASDAVAGTYSDITNNTVNPTLTGVNTANSFHSLSIRADQMPAGKPFLKAIATETGGGNCTVAIVLDGEDGAHQPGSDNDNITWTNNVDVS